MIRIPGLLICVLSVLASTVIAEDDVLFTKGERREANVSGGAGAWKIGDQNHKFSDVLVIRFSPDGPPSRMPSGVFIRGGSLIAGTLTSIIGDVAEVSSSAFGPLKLKKDDIAGAFSPLPAGQTENLPELARYPNLLAATLGNASATLQPGKRCRVRFAGLDEVNAERVMRVGADQILLSTKSKAVEPVNRQFVRLLEIKVPDAPPPAPEDTKLGPEVIVRLKGGDLLRGRVVKLDDKGLTLRTAYIGEKVIERGMLGVLFLAGGEGSGVTWLSTLSPSKAVHTPLFDSEFPHRMDASNGGGDINIKGLPCERGIGVHSKSDLEFTLSSAPARLLTVCGIDSETKGRGSVVAKIVADGKEVWKSKALTGNDPAEIVSVDIGTAKTLNLQVDFGPDEDDSGDHFDWGWAALIGK